MPTIVDDKDLFVGDDSAFFAAPASEPALAELYDRHRDAVLLGGATDVGLWITKMLRDPRKIIWLGRVAGLDRMEASADGLDIYATTSLERAMPKLAELHPDLGEIMRRFGSAQVRVSGTVGGNIANGSPIGDLPPALIALGREPSNCGAAKSRASCRWRISSSPTASRIGRPANMCAAFMRPD